MFQQLQRSVARQVQAGPRLIVDPELKDYLSIPLNDDGPISTLGQIFLLGQFQEKWDFLPNQVAMSEGHF